MCSCVFPLTHCFVSSVCAVCLSVCLNVCLSDCRNVACVFFALIACSPAYLCSASCCVLSVESRCCWMSSTTGQFMLVLQATCQRWVYCHWFAHTGRLASPLSLLLFLCSQVLRTFLPHETSSHRIGDASYYDDGLKKTFWSTNTQSYYTA